MLVCWAVSKEVGRGVWWSAELEALVQKVAVECSDGYDFGVPVVEDVALGQGQFIGGEAFHASTDIGQS